MPSGTARRPTIAALCGSISTRLSAPVGDRSATHTAPSPASIARGSPFMRIGWPATCPVLAWTWTTSRCAATVTHSIPRRDAMSVIPKPRRGPGRWWFVEVEIRPSVGLPGLATHALPPATSTLTGRRATRTVPATCGATTAGRAGGVAARAAGGRAGAVVAVEAAATGPSCPRPASTTASAAPAAADAATTATARETRRSGRRRGASAQVADPGVRPACAVRPRARRPRR